MNAPEDAARSLLRRRLRPELDAGGPRARALIRTFLTPVTAIERVHIRQRARSRARDRRRLAASTCPGTTTRRWTATRCASRDLAPDGETVADARSASRSPASRATAPIGAGPVRADLHRRRDAAQAPTPSSCRSARPKTDGRVRVAPGAVAEGGHEPPLRRRGPEARTASCFAPASSCTRPSSACWRRSASARSRVYRKLRVAFFSTGDELKSIGTPLAAGEIYDSNRYTLYGMLTRLNCDVARHGRRAPTIPRRSSARSRRCGDRPTS